MKNILIICHDYTSSGANKALLDLLQEADLKNNNFFVLIPRKYTNFAQELEKIGCTVWIESYIVELKHLYKDNLKEKLKQIIKNIYAKIFNGFVEYKIIKRIKSNNIDIIHSNSFSVYLGAKISQKLNINHVWHIREFMEEDHQITHYNKKKISELVEYSNAIFISKALKEAYDLKQYKFKKSVIIYDNVKFDNGYIKKRKFMEDGICNILIAGILTENKGQEQAIMAMSKLNNKKIHLFICGIGPDEERLKYIVKKNKVENIHFMGYINNLNEYRKNMDIALVCSKSEAFGRVTVEGMYYENLVIASDSGGTKELLINSTGLLYKYNDIEKLIQNIEFAINNKKESEKMIKKARDIALKNFNKNIFLEVKQFYDEI